MRPRFSEHIAGRAASDQSGRRMLVAALICLYFPPDMRKTVFEQYRYRGLSRLITDLRGRKPVDTPEQTILKALAPADKKLAFHVCSVLPETPTHYIPLGLNEAGLWGLRSKHVRESKVPYVSGVLLGDEKSILNPLEIFTRFPVQRLRATHNSRASTIMSDWEQRRMASHAAVVAGFHGSLYDGGTTMRLVTKDYGKIGLIPDWNSGDGWVKPYDFRPGRHLPHAAGQNKPACVVYADASGFDMRGYEHKPFILPKANRHLGDPPGDIGVFLSHLIRSMLVPMVLVREEGISYYCGISHDPETGFEEVVVYHKTTKLDRRIPAVFLENYRPVPSADLLQILAAVWAIDDPAAYAQEQRLYRLACLFDYLRLMGDTAVREYYANKGIVLPDALPRLEKIA